MRQQQKSIKGFNILELIVVLAIISVISAMAYPNFNSWRKERIIRAAAIDIKNLLENVSAQVQRGSYGFAQVELSETSGSVTAVSRGMKNDRLLSKIRDAESTWYTATENLRCRMSNNEGFTTDDDPDTAEDESNSYWSDDGSVNIDDDSDNDLAQVNVREFDDITLNFSGTEAAVCFSTDGSWYQGNGEFENVNVLYICNKSLAYNQCGIAVTGDPNIEHENLYEISWTRFGNITMQKWVEDKRNNIWKWALQ